MNRLIIKAIVDRNPVVTHKQYDSNGMLIHTETALEAAEREIRADINSQLDELKEDVKAAHIVIDGLDSSNPIIREYAEKMREAFEVELSEYDK